MNPADRSIHGCRNSNSKIEKRLLSPHQRNDNRLLGSDASIEISKTLFGWLPIEDGGMTGMRKYKLLLKITQCCCSIMALAL